MPSWPIHIAIAHKVNKKLNLNDDFILGSVLPDILDGYIIKSSNITDKNLSHFKRWKDNKQKLRNFGNETI